MPSLSSWLFPLLALTTLSSVFASPTRTYPGRSPPTSPFVTASGDGLLLNGSKFRFIGTNAYWLPYLNSDDDISKTFADIAASGIKVVRTWAFNDVTEIPEAGTWLQLIANGTTTINTGPNGLQRLDKLLELAAEHDIYVLFSLTNNWNPVVNAPSTPARRNNGPAPLPRNFLSNDYGGMDAYVRAFTETKTHDEFYTDQTIRKFFQHYLQAVVSRFVDNTRLLAWELANDPRCSSSLDSSPSCNTQTITQWHSDIAKFIRSIDPNHLVTSGNQGFFCPDCPKLFFNNAPPPPAASPVPGGSRKRSTRGLMTPSKLFKMVTEERRAAPRASIPRDGVKIRGRWTASPEAKRQSGGVGSAFDGTFGVDSQDILSIPEIGFGSFQLFPDQNSYGTVPTQFTPPSSDFTGTVQQGTAWIQAQAAAALAVGKPVALTGFGLVSQNNFPAFVPFNDTSPVATPSSQNQKRQSLGTFGTGVADQQLQSAYATWLQAGIQAGLSGMTQYQWSSQNLQPAPGTFVQSPNGQGTFGSSPNDGYGILGTGQSSIQQILQDASQNLT